jgi:diaminopimelate epimerase
MRRIDFFKMHGLGNDFVVLDARREPIVLDAIAARGLADRRTGIGCDQLIVIEPARLPASRAFMRIVNADGSEAEACGNATRCVAWLIGQEIAEPRFGIETVAGLLHAELLADGRISVDMGPVRTDWREIPLARRMDTTRVKLTAGPLAQPVCSNIGNPHATFFVPDAEAIDLALLGPMLEHDPLFPERANIGVATVRDGEHIRLRVWERGAGLTPACGSGACAALAAAHRRRLTGRFATVTLDGGELDILWHEDDPDNNEPGHIVMTGPAMLVYEGGFDAGLLGR